MTRLILASKSASRRAMLHAAGVEYDALPADIDERAIEQNLRGATSAEIAEALSVAKAAALASEHRQALLPGSDSLVVLDGQRFDKSTSREDAAEHLLSTVVTKFEDEVLKRELLHSALGELANVTCIQLIKNNSFKDTFGEVSMQPPIIWDAQCDETKLCKGTVVELRSHGSLFVPFIQ